MSTAIDLLADASFEVRDAMLIGLVCLLVEILVWRRSWRDAVKTFPSSARINLCVLVFNLVVTAVPLAFLLGGMYDFIGGHGMAILAASAFDGIPGWCNVAIALFIGDLVIYWRHRLQHTPWLWRFHNLHHSDEQMTWLTLGRFHPVDRMLAPLIDLTVLALLGLPAWAVAAAMLLLHYCSYIHHANLPWTLGPLKWILVSPAQHRWHHSLMEAGYRANYAGFFSCIDVLFGTFYCPGPCREPTGVEGEPIGSFKALMLKPLLPPSRPKPPPQSGYMPML